LGNLLIRHCLLNLNINQFYQTLDKVKATDINFAQQNLFLKRREGFCLSYCQRVQRANFGFAEEHIAYTLLIRLNNFQLASFRLHFYQRGFTFILPKHIYSLSKIKKSNYMITQLYPGI
jgi:hypothetical protein